MHVDLGGSRNTFYFLKYGIPGLPLDTSPRPFQSLPSFLEANQGRLQETGQKPLTHLRKLLLGLNHEQDSEETSLSTGREQKTTNLQQHNTHYQEGKQDSKAGGIMDDKSMPG